MAEYNGKKGIWRTVGGRRIFIAEGEDLATAMKNSGKFGKREARIKESQEDKIKDWRNFRNNSQKSLDRSSVPQSKEVFRRDRDRADEEIKKMQKEMDYYNNPRETKKDISDLEGKHIENQRTTRQVKEEISKSQKTGNDYLPKASKIMTSGTSNRKEVSDNIQAHILEHYDSPVDFMEQMDAFDYLPTKWKAGEEIAKGGNYLIYNEDMANYLNDLNINPKGKKFSEEKSFEMYTSLVGRESEKLYNKLEKLFEQYKKEHNNSNATLEDFRKWFK